MIANFSGATADEWIAKCISLLPSDIHHGLVDVQGQPVPSFDTNTWGINVKTCYQYCNGRSLPFVWVSI